MKVGQRNESGSAETSVDYNDEPKEQKAPRGDLNTADQLREAAQSGCGGKLSSRRLKCRMRMRVRVTISVNEQVAGEDARQG